MAKKKTDVTKNTEGTTSIAQPVKKSGKEHKNEPAKTRVWEVQSYLNSNENEELLSKEKIQDYLSKFEYGIKRWAWVIHDKDHYSLADVEENAARNGGHATISMNQDKPAHMHVALEFYNPVYASAIAKDIGLPLRQIQKAKAKRNQFMAIASYFTHEDEKQQALDKYRYEDNEIHCNFDYRAEVDAYFEHRHIASAANMKRNQVYELIGKVEIGEISLSQIKKRYGLGFFLDYEQKFLKAHMEYMKKHYKMRTRISYYIEGVSGTGKSSLAELLARCLYLDEGYDESDTYYTAGDKKVRFDNYQHQPVIIWDDVRSASLVDEFTREELLNILETHPKKRVYNIKYGSVMLTQDVNIFTGIESYKDFLKGLAGEEEAKQINRRIPIVISVHPNDIEVLINRGVFELGDHYDEYVRYAKIGLSVRSMNIHFDDAHRLMLASEALIPVLKKHREYMEANYEKKLYTYVDDVPVVEIVTGKELDAENDTALVAYNEYLKAWKKEYGSIDTETEAEQDETKKKLSFEDWKRKGRPKTGGIKLAYEDVYKGGPQTDEKRQKIEQWIKEAKGLDLEGDTEDFSAEDWAKVNWYEEMIIHLNELYEAFRQEETSEAFDNCIAAFGHNYEKFSEEPVTLRIVALGVEKGYIQDERNVEMYIADLEMKKLEPKQPEQNAIKSESENVENVNLENVEICSNVPSVENEAESDPLSSK